jgi:peptidylprolyl isomerase
MTLRATQGHKVVVHYKGTFPDGEVFDNSRDHGSGMEILLGQNTLLKGFDEAMVGMTEGEVKTINLTCGEAYGDINPHAIISVPREAFSKDFEFKVGNMVTGTGPEGHPVRAKILEVNNKEIKLDHNHPLAGKDIQFEIEMVEIQSQTASSE